MIGPDPRAWTRLEWAEFFMFNPATVNLARAAIEDVTAGSPDPAQRPCDLAPPGWRCIRGLGHRGGCEAVPVDPSIPTSPNSPFYPGGGAIPPPGQQLDRPPYGGWPITKNTVVPDPVDPPFVAKTAIPNHPKVETAMVPDLPPGLQNQGTIYR